VNIRSVAVHQEQRRVRVSASSMTPIQLVTGTRECDLVRRRVGGATGRDLSGTEQEWQGEGNCRGSEMARR
jgi:hypothetical protein